MHNKIFNTLFEISMRLLLNLSLNDKQGRTLDELITADFITNYSKEFELTDANLHGESEFSFSEFSTRRLLAQDALKSLVLKNMVDVTSTQKGFLYSISNQGFKFCKSLTSDYAVEYTYYARKANDFMKTKNEKELLDIIITKASDALRKD